MLEGASRPGHFRGVATVVTKLFNIVQPDVACFGEKDFQQLAVIRKMVEDLSLPVAISICPIVREPDGLAMSSRNQYLSATERVQALALSQALNLASQMVTAGERNTRELEAAMRDFLLDSKLAQIDYVRVVDSASLAEIERVGQHAVALIAARVGKTRLIDNCLLG